MRIILSRKGFDSSAGKVPSPIFPSGEMRSIPIPEGHQTDGPITYYNEIETPHGNLGRIVEMLTRGKIARASRAHLDPDLDFDAISNRPIGWRPLFGQAGGAETHLQQQGIGPGDIFLFFGWFRAVEEADGVWRYVRNAPDRHVIFGWLQIERRVLSSDKESLPTWASAHPHYGRGATHTRPDSIYLSTDHLRLDGAETELPGGGLFAYYRPALCLTAEGKSRSIWSLPAWLHPEGKQSTLGHHSNLHRWFMQGERALLRTVGRGQEFVLDCDHYPEAAGWLKYLLAHAGSDHSRPLPGE